LEIKIARTRSQIARCHPVMVQLRPNITLERFLLQVERQSKRDGYRLAFLESRGKVRAVAGFRVSEMLARGKFLYVDDLVTDERMRSKGFGGLLFCWLVDYAQSLGYDRVDLDSGLQRKAAHRFYLRKRMVLQGYHFTLEIGKRGAWHRRDSRILKYVPESSRASDRPAPPEGKSRRTRKRDSRTHVRNDSRGYGS
jgi:GNAT superfamily N-acetyltransferase